MRSRAKQEHRAGAGGALSRCGSRPALPTGCGLREGGGGLWLALLGFTFSHKSRFTVSLDYFVFSCHPAGSYPPVSVAPFSLSRDEQALGLFSVIKEQ